MKKINFIKLLIKIDIFLFFLFIILLIFNVINLFHNSIPNFGQSNNELQILENYIISCKTNFCISPNLIIFNEGVQSLNDFYVVIRKPIPSNIEIYGGYYLNNENIGNYSENKLIFNIGKNGQYNKFFKIFCPGLTLKPGQKDGMICRIREIKNSKKKMLNMEIKFQPSKKNNKSIYYKYITLKTK